MQGHLSPLLLSVLWGTRAPAWRQGTWMGLIMFQTAVVRVSGMQSKPVGPFHNLPVPLSSDLYTTAQ